jgi:hypothetical protein
MNSKNNREEILRRFEKLLAFENDKEKLEFEASKIHLDFIVDLSGIMEEKGISKSMLAEQLGTSKSYISQLFSGDKLINLILLARIQRIFQINFNVSHMKSPEYASGFREKIRKEGYQTYNPGLTVDFINNCLKKVS